MIVAEPARTLDELGADLVREVVRPLVGVAIVLVAVLLLALCATWFWARR